MQAENDILSLLEAQSARSAKEMKRAVILQPGALGDCILTLPLVKLVKEALDLGGVDLVGHSDYVGILPERSCVDGIRSLESLDLHKLFVEPTRFDLADRDPLIHLFADYSWIITFLGEPGSDFEQNLIFTANCSRNAEVVTLPLKPPAGHAQHITEYHTEQLARQSGLPLEKAIVDKKGVQVRVADADRDRGVEMLEQAGIDQRGYGLAILVDDDAVVAILDLIEHFAQVLSEGDGACLGNHHVTPVLIIMVIMVLLAYGVNLT